MPYSSIPWSTGNIAESPIATNIPARYGLQAGVLKRSKIETHAHPRPIEHI